MKTIRIIATLLILGLLVLAGCGKGKIPTYHVGTEGLTLAFAKETPTEVYEESEEPIVITLANKGAADVAYNQIIFNLKGDPFYLDVAQDPQLSNQEDASQNVFQNLFAQQNLFQQPYYAGTPAMDTTQLFHGKSIDFPEGDMLELVPIASFKKIKGLREQPETQLYASVCYPYNTYLATTMCVDANAFNGNKQKQVCSAQTLTYASQGAPVAVIEVENRPAPIRISSGQLAEGGRGYLDIVQPTFIVHIKNVGGGAVLPLPETKDAVLESCTQRTALDQMNGVIVNATLSNLQLECSPNPVMLRDEEGFTLCSLPVSAQEKLATPNYLATFTVQLNYLYRNAISQDVEIQRRSPLVYPTNLTYPERDENPGYINGVPRCDYCSQNKNAAGCDGWPTNVDEAAVFSCVCSEKECLKKTADGKCVYGHTWCPGTNFCCAPG